MLSIGDRMKQYYEDRYRIKLTRRTPVIVRVDGKSFHTLTKKYNKPFDATFVDAMYITGEYLLKNTQGAKVAYIQSDEISLLITDFDELNTHGVFDYNVQKIVSIISSMASVQLSSILLTEAIFDGRVFNIPKEDVYNYFLWRQQDWTRNSIQMLAQSLYSHKELHKKNSSDLQEMCFAKGYNWNDLTGNLKNGIFISKEDGYYPGKIQNNKNYIERYLYEEESKR